MLKLARSCRGRFIEFLPTNSSSSVFDVVQAVVFLAPSTKCALRQPLNVLDLLQNAIAVIANFLISCALRLLSGVLPFPFPEGVEHVAVTDADNGGLRVPLSLTLRFLTQILVDFEDKKKYEKVHFLYLFTLL